MQYIVVISSRLSSFLLCSLKNSFFWFSSSFQDVVSFFESVPFGLGALFFFSLFCVVSHYLCGCVCVFSFFFCSLVCSTYVRNCQLKRAHASSRRRERYHSVTNLGRKRQKSVVPSERKATKQRETPRYCVQRRRRRA